GRGQDGDVFEFVFALPFGAITADQVMELGGAHFFLKFGLDQEIAQQLVGGHQAVRVRNDDVIDANQVVIAEVDVIELEAARVDGIVQGKMHVVVQVRAGGDDPID